LKINAKFRGINNIKGIRKGQVSGKESVAYENEKIQIQIQIQMNVSAAWVYSGCIIYVGV